MTNEHEVTIIVNGTKHPFPKGKISFDQVVALAFNPVPSGPNILITVAYRRGSAPTPQGTLQPGWSVEVVNDMIFDVTATDKS